MNDREWLSKVWEQGDEVKYLAAVKEAAGTDYRVLYGRELFRSETAAYIGLQTGWGSRDEEMYLDALASVREISRGMYEMILNSGKGATEALDDQYGNSLGGGEKWDGGYDQDWLTTGKDTHNNNHHTPAVKEPWAPFVRNFGAIGALLALWSIGGEAAVGTALTAALIITLWEMMVTTT